MTKKSSTTAHDVHLPCERKLATTAEAQLILRVGRTNLTKGHQDGTYPPPFKLPRPNGKLSRANYWYVEVLHEFVSKKSDGYLEAQLKPTHRDAYFHALARPLQAPGLRFVSELGQLSHCIASPQKSAYGKYPARETKQTSLRASDGDQGSVAV